MNLPRPLRSLLVLSPVLALAACAVTFPPPGGGPPQISVPGKSHQTPSDPPATKAGAAGATATNNPAANTPAAKPSAAGAAAAAASGTGAAAAEPSAGAGQTSSGSANSNAALTDPAASPASTQAAQAGASTAAAAPQPARDPAQRTLAARPPAHPALAPLAWLEGRWEAHDQGRGGVPRQRLESYGPILGSVLQGSYIEVEAGEPKLHELISIEARPEGVFLYLRHFSAGLVPWKSENQGPQTYRLVAVDAQQAVFERAPAAPGQPVDPDHSRLIYSRRGPDLSVRLEHQDGSGGLEFEFLRTP